MQSYKINKKNILVSKTPGLKEHEVNFQKKENGITKKFIMSSAHLSFRSHYNPFEAKYYIISNRQAYFDLQIVCSSGRMHDAIFQAYEQVEIDLTEYPNGIYYALILENGKVLDKKTIFWIE